MLLILNTSVTAIISTVIVRSLRFMNRLWKLLELHLRRYRSNFRSVLIGILRFEEVTQLSVSMQGILLTTGPHSENLLRAPRSAAQRVCLHPEQVKENVHVFALSSSHTILYNLFPSSPTF